MSDETPWEFVKRRRTEGATAEVLKGELFARGLDSADVALLLDEPVLGPGLAPEAEVRAPAAEGTPWALVQKLRAEGFPREAIVRELVAQGHTRADVEALLIDEAPDGAEPPAAGEGSGVPVQLLFGLLLLAAGVVVLLGTGVRALPLVLIGSGIVRVVSALQADRSLVARRAAARRTMVELAPEDPRARCAVHPQYASIGNCPRCGSFGCARCAPARGFEAGLECMKCQGLPEVIAARRRKAARQASAWLMTAPAMLLFLLFTEAAFGASDFSPLRALLVAMVVSLPWLVLSAVQAVVKSGWPTALSVAPWLLVEFSVGVASEGRAALQLTLWLIPLGAAFVGWMGTRHAARPEPPLVAPAQ
ncbi:MAG: hypothetical protein AB1938_21745 [Myxococcota bacterium]